MYFNRVYISGSYHQMLNTGGMPGVLFHHIQPMFPLQMWNVHKVKISDQPCTNNICKGWNIMFFNLIGYPHPSIWQLIKGLQNEYGAVFTVRLDTVGNPLHRHKRNRYVQLQYRLKHLCAKVKKQHRNFCKVLVGTLHTSTSTKVI